MCKRPSENAASWKEGMRLALPKVAEQGRGMLTRVYRVLLRRTDLTIRDRSLIYSFLFFLSSFLFSPPWCMSHMQV